MRLLISLISALTLVSIFTLAAMADFSADTVTTSPHGKVTGKMYSTSNNGYAGGMSRTETTAEGHTSIMIIDQDKKIVYMLMPEQKMYMKQKYEPNDPKQQKSSIAKPVSKTFIRNDKFDGHPVKVYKAVTDDNKEAIIWEATDLNNFPVKIEMPSEKATMEYHNVSTKPVDKSKFSIPAGYKEFDMSNMMGGFGE